MLSIFSANYQLGRDLCCETNSDSLATFNWRNKKKCKRLGHSLWTKGWRVKVFDIQAFSRYNNIEWKITGFLPDHYHSMHFSPSFSIQAIKVIVAKTENKFLRHFLSFLSLWPIQKQHLALSLFRSFAQLEAYIQTCILKLQRKNKQA